MELFEALAEGRQAAAAVCPHLGVLRRDGHQGRAARLLPVLPRRHSHLQLLRVHGDDGRHLRELHVLGRCDEEFAERENTDR